MCSSDLCQDTGIVNVFVKWGMECRLDDTSRSLQEVVDEGVRRAYLHPENRLRASVLRDPAFSRVNTKDNTPCVLTVEMVPGDTCFFPADQMHLFQVTSETPVKLLVIYTPPYGESPDKVIRPAVDAQGGH